MTMRRHDEVLIVCVVCLVSAAVSCSRRGGAYPAMPAVADSGTDRDATSRPPTDGGPAIECARVIEWDNEPWTPEPTFVLRYAIDEDGHPLRVESRDAAGALVYTSTFTRVSNTITEERDDGADGTVDHREAYTRAYDSLDRMVTLEMDLEGDGWFEHHYVWAYAGDSRGVVTVDYEVRPEPEGAVTATAHEIWENDDHDRPLRRRVEFSSGQVDTLEYAYTDPTGIRAGTTDIDRLADGTVDIHLEWWHEGDGCAAEPRPEYVLF